jgi:hypothetical protein
VTSAEPRATSAVVTAALRVRDRYFWTWNSP